MRLQPTNRFSVEADPEIVASFEVIREVTNGITLDATKFPADTDGNKIIRIGMPVAKITSNGKYRPYTGTTVQTTAASGATAVILADVSRLIVGDEVTIGNETKTISAINRETKTITVTALSAERIAGTAVATTDGGADPTAILKRSINVKDGDHVVGGYEYVKVWAARLPLTVDAALRAKMPHVVFAE